MWDAGLYQFRLSGVPQAEGLVDGLNDRRRRDRSGIILQAGTRGGMFRPGTKRALRMANKTPGQQCYLIVMAVVAWLAVFLQIWLVMQTYVANGDSAIRGLVNTLSYFTVLTNLVVALVTTAAALRRKLDSFLTRPGTMTAVAVYIFVVGLVYSLFLRSIWDPTGLQLVADVALHDVVPVLYVMYWLIFVPKRSLSWVQPLYWLIYPLAYFGYALVRGEIIGKYPYWFADPTALGYPRTFANSALLLVGFLVLGEIAVAIIAAGDDFPGVRHQRLETRDRSAEAQQRHRNERGVYHFSGNRGMRRSIGGFGWNPGPTRGDRSDPADVRIDREKEFRVAHRFLGQGRHRRLEL